VKSRGREIVLLLVIVGLAVVGELSNSSFFSFRNITALFENTAVIVLVVIGESLVIINGFGHIDLSVSSIYTVSAVTSAELAAKGVSMFLVVPWSVAVGVALGALNGIVTVEFGIPSLITTLGTMIGWEGFILWWTGGMWIANLPDSWQIGSYKIASISVATWLGFLVSIVLVFLARRAAFFRKFYVCGSNASAASFVGISTKRTIFHALILSGAFSGFSGMLSASRFFSVTSNIGSNLTLPVIASAVIGGTSIFGGKGRIEGAILGTFLLVEILSVTVFLNIGAVWNEAIEGVVILVAIISDVLREKRNIRGIGVK